jgi:hypothetical protein
MKANKKSSYPGKTSSAKVTSKIIQTLLVFFSEQLLPETDLTQPRLIVTSPPDVYPENIEHALLDPFQRPYWTRLWILQEILLARSLVVCCGNLHVQWSQFERFFALSFDIKGVQDHFRQRFGRGRLIVRDELQTARLIVNEKTNLLQVKSLRHILGTFSKWQCEESRDKVYGYSVSRRAMGSSSITKSRYVRSSPTSLRKLWTFGYGDCLSIETHIEFGKMLMEALNSNGEDIALAALDVEDYVRSVCGPRRELNWSSSGEESEG